MEGVKRTEMFEHLRKANCSNTITKKFSALNSTPNVLVRAKQPGDISGTMSQRLPHMSPNLSNISLKPPTLKQLRMEAI